MTSAALSLHTALAGCWLHPRLSAALHVPGGFQAFGLGSSSASTVQPVCPAWEHWVMALGILVLAPLWLYICHWNSLLLSRDTVSAIASETTGTLQLLYYGHGTCHSSALVNSPPGGFGQGLVSTLGG